MSAVTRMLLAAVVAALFASALTLLAAQLSGGLPGSGRLLLIWALGQGAGLLLLTTLLMLLRRRLRSMLERIRAQILALGEGRFVFEVQPPVAELVDLARSVNVTIARIQHVQEAQHREVVALREEVATDPLTGLPSRGHFMTALGAALNVEVGAGAPPDTAIHAGLVMILRVHDLVGVNQRGGRERADDLLRTVAMLLRTHAVRLGGEGVELARLNGADFALLAGPVALATFEAWLQGLADALAALEHDAIADSRHVAWLGASTFVAKEALSQVLVRVDAMLQACESQRQPWRLSTASAPDPIYASTQWRFFIDRALESGMVSLQYYPVLGRDGGLLHQEASLRMSLPDGSVVAGASVIPAVERAGRTLDVDLRVIELVLLELQAGDGRIAVNVAPQSVVRPTFLDRLGVLLAAAPAAASRLLLELHERVLEHDAEALEALAAVLKPYGTRLGIDHFARELPRTFDLPAHGVSFLKLDGALCDGIADSPQRGRVARVVRSMIEGGGCDIIATGVRQRGDLQALWAADFDGATGPPSRPSTAP